MEIISQIETTRQVKNSESKGRVLAEESQQQDFNKTEKAGLFKPLMY